MMTRCVTTGTAWVLFLMLSGLPTSHAEEKRQSLRIGDGGSLYTLDPHAASSSLEFHVVEACFEGLTYIDPETLEPVPGLARTWTTSEDGLTWRFELRPEARWADGERVTAPDVAASIRRSLAPDTAGAMAFLLHAIAGARAFNAHPDAIDMLLGEGERMSIVAELVALAAKHPDGLDAAGLRATGIPGRLRQTLRDTHGALVRAALGETRPRWTTEDLIGLSSALLKTVETLRKEHGAAKRDFGRRLGVVADGPSRLRIDLAHPEPMLPYLLAQPVAAPLPASMRRRVPREFPVEDGAHRASWWERMPLEGNGPYRITRWTREPEAGQVSVRLEKNPRYWNAAAIRQATIEIVHVPNPHESLRMFTEERIDWARSYPRALRTALSQTKTFRSRDGNITYFYLFNCQHPALRDARVRRALAQAVDRGNLLKMLAFGGSPTPSLIPDVMPGYDGGSDALAFDPEAARALLAEAGHPGGKGLPELEILYNTSETHRAIAEFVAAGWQKHLGIRAKTVNETWPVYQERKLEGAYEVARMGWIADYPSPRSFLELFETGGANNTTGWADPEFDSLLSKARRERDHAKRQALYASAERRLLDAAPCVPIYAYDVSDLVHPWVRGFRTHAKPKTPGTRRTPNGGQLHPFRGLWIERK